MRLAVVRKSIVMLTVVIDPLINSFLGGDYYLHKASLLGPIFVSGMLITSPASALIWYLPIFVLYVQCWVIPVF